MIKNITYKKGSRHSQEELAFTVERKEFGALPCKAATVLLLAGINRYRAVGTGQAVTLLPEEVLDLLLSVKEEREKLRRMYPVKTLKAWDESGIMSFEDFFRPGDTVDRAVVDHLINAIPPTIELSFYFQGGEVFSYERAGKDGIRPTFATFVRTDEEDQWLFEGYCFYMEHENRYLHGSALDRAIKKAQETAEQEG